jgi:hypothetical protein
LPKTPDLTAAKTVYRKAYIEVDDEGGWNSTLPFEPYRDYGIQHSLRGNKNLGRDFYWIGYILSAWQSPQELAGDPDYLAVRGCSTPADQTKAGCAVFVESHRDHNALLATAEPLGMVVAHELAHSLPSVGGGHPEVQRTIIQKISSVQFKVNGPPTQAGYNITAGSQVRILVPGQPWYKAETAVGWLQSWQQVSDGYIITLQGSLKYLKYGPRSQVQWNYLTGDTAQFWSKCVMGQVQAVEDFCPTWLDRIRSNIHTPLEWIGEGQ